LNLLLYKDIEKGFKQIGLFIKEKDHLSMAPSRIKDAPNLIGAKTIKDYS